MKPDLTVIIPALNEQESLGPLLADLGRQEWLKLEVVLADGGSADGTRAAFDAAPLKHKKWVDAPRGRASQMNAGAAGATAADLLFLHADSRLADPEMLWKARENLKGARARHGDRVAGHFGILFNDKAGRPGFYYFYEAKSRTSRPFTVNGDQGTWLSKEYFGELGGFDETLPFMEDARLEAAVRRTGRWVTLPGRLVTSARRLETEGPAARQTLNALIRNFDAIGFTRFLRHAGEVYKEHHRADGGLYLPPFIALAHRISLRGGLWGWWCWWLATGRFVRSHAWQLAFALDCRRNRRRGFKPGDGPTPITDRFEKWFDRLTDNAVCHGVTALLTMAVIFGLWGWLALKNKLSGREKPFERKSVRER